MKTAMQRMLTYIEHMENANFDLDVQYVKETAINLIEIEKQQIIDAVAHGFGDATSIKPDNSFEQYYNEAFDGI